MTTDQPDPNEATKELAIAVGALTIVLLDNGIVTPQQYDQARAQATVIIDQEFARKRDAEQPEGPTP